MLNTRLCKKASGNNLFHIVDEQGNKIATVETSGEKAELIISTKPEYHIEKPNGYTSKRAKNE
jgi:hypothetical protein